MFGNQKKGSADITSGDPQFVVRYVGKTETYTALGKGCTQNAVQRIWDNSVEEKFLRRVMMTITSRGILVRDLEGKRTDPEVIFDIKEVAYCAAEKGAHERVFAWISKNPRTKKTECHAVLCASKEKAQGLAVSLHRAFHVAYRDWKTRKERDARADLRGHLQPNGAESPTGSTSDTRAENKKSSRHKGHVNRAPPNGDAGDVHLPNDVSARQRFHDDGASCSSGSQDSSRESTRRASLESDNEVGNNPFLESAMARMYIVEEDEITMTVDGSSFSTVSHGKG